MGSEIPRGAFAWLIKLYKRQELLQPSEWLTKPPRIDHREPTVLPWNTSRLLHPGWGDLGNRFPYHHIVGHNFRTSVR